MTSPVAPITAVEVLDHAASRTPDMNALVEQFSRLLAQDPPRTEAAPVWDGSPTPMSQFVKMQEDAIRQTYADVREFSAQAPTMGMHEMAARQIELQFQISTVQVQFNAGVYVAQSSKTGLQTLMKNQ